MPTNNILPFCGTDTGTNLLTQGAYAAADDRTSGNKPGVASSKLVNKAVRQAAFICSQIAQFICDRTGQDVLDNADTATLLTNMKAAFNGFTVAVLAKTASYTLLTTDDIVTFDATAGAKTATLPSAASCKGKVFVITKIDSSANAVTLARAGSDTILGATSFILKGQYDTVQIASDGVASWIVIAG